MEEDGDVVGELIRRDDVGFAVPVQVGDRHRNREGTHGEALRGLERAVAVAQEDGNQAVFGARDDVEDAIGVHVGQGERFRGGARGRAPLGLERAVAVAGEDGDVAGVKKGTGLLLASMLLILGP